MFMMCQRIGFPPISTIGLGRITVSSDNRDPRPPARITAFIFPPLLPSAERGPACLRGRPGLTDATRNFCALRSSAILASDGYGELIPKGSRSERQIDCGMRIDSSGGGEIAVEQTAQHGRRTHRTLVERAHDHHVVHRADGGELVGD